MSRRPIASSVPGARSLTVTGRLLRVIWEWRPPGSCMIVLGRLPATKDSSDEYLYRLSLGLNVSQLGNVARARFAANVRLSMQRRFPLRCADPYRSSNGSPET